VNSLNQTRRGMLSVHKNFLVSCSERTCPMSRSSEQALGSHSCVVVCHEPRCVPCANEKIGQGDSGLTRQAGHSLTVQ
jgi:hypothetical protein